MNLSRPKIVNQRRNLRRASRRQVGIAFGGGGARGLAHVGVLRALGAYPGTYPNIFAGTSAGSIAAVAAAAGLSVQEIETFSSQLDWIRHVIRLTDMVKFGGENRAGLLPNTKLADVINELIGHRSFDDLPFDCAVVAADIDRRARVIITSNRVARHIDRRELETFLPPRANNRPGLETIILSDVQDVGLAVRASCAVPGIFRPVKVHDLSLVDGGIVDQTPTDVVRAMGAGFTIAVSLALSFTPPKMMNALHAISGTIGVLGAPQLRRSIELADIGFEVSGIEGRSPIQPGQLDLIEIGERDMYEQLDMHFGPYLKRLAATAS